MRRDLRAFATGLVLKARRIENDKDYEIWINASKFNFDFCPIWRKSWAKRRDGRDLCLLLVKE